MRVSLVVLLVLIALPAPAARSREPADVTGGAGKLPCVVTNRDDSGVGSLRWALTTCAEAGGGAVVTFAVSGAIAIRAGDIVAAHGNLTLDGGSAPDQGVVVVGPYQVQVRGANTIVRNMRFLGAGEIAEDGGVTLSKDGLTVRASDVVVEHCLLAGATDENLSVYGGDAPVRNVTVRYSVMARPRTHKNVLVDRDTDAVTFYRNLSATSSDRCLFFTLEGAKAPRQHRAVENALYDCVYSIRAAAFTAKDTLGVEVVRNMFLRGPLSGGRVVREKRPVLLHQSNLGRVLFSGAGNVALDRAEPWPAFPTQADLFGREAPPMRLPSAACTAPGCGQFVDARAGEPSSQLAGQALVAHLVATAGPRLPCVDAYTAEVLRDVETGTRSVAWSYPMPAPRIPDTTRSCGTKAFLP